MKRIIFYFMVVLPAILFLDCNLTFSAQICNRIVAIVNDEVITLHELNRKIKELSGKDPSDLENQDKEGYMKARRRIIDMLIDEKLAQNKVKELGIEVEPKEMDAAIERIKMRNHWTQEDLMAGLDNQGVSIEQYRKNIKKELEQMRLIDFEVKSKIIVRDETIKKYYNDHLDKFKSEERVRLATIVLVNRGVPESGSAASISKKAEDIFSRLKKGEDFSELAKKFSQGPGAEDGGDLGFIKTSQLDPRLKETINHMAVGEVSRPIINPSGAQIIKLEEKEAGGTKPFAVVKDAIYDTLYSKEINERYSSWIKALREKSYIKIIF